MASSGMLLRVALVRTDVSEEITASIIRVTRIGVLGTTLAVTSNRRTLLFHQENRCSTFLILLRNIFIPLFAIFPPQIPTNMTKNFIFRILGISMLNILFLFLFGQLLYSNTFGRYRYIYTSRSLLQSYGIQRRVVGV
jgi:hypothetical protein